jgi:hypothetical protein
MPAALKAVLDGLPDPLLLLDSKRRLIFHNAAAGRVLDAEGGFAVVGGRMPPGPGCLPVARKRIHRDWLLLVPAEIAASNALLNNGSTQSASRSLHRSKETIRSHLRSVFAGADPASNTGEPR